MSLYEKILNDTQQRRKVMGIAFNYFTNALKTEPSKVKLP